MKRTRLINSISKTIQQKTCDGLGTKCEKTEEVEVKDKLCKFSNHLIQQMLNPQTIFNPNFCKVQTLLLTPWQKLRIPSSNFWPSWRLNGRFLEAKFINKNILSSNWLLIYVHQITKYDHQAYPMDEYMFLIMVNKW